MMAASLETIRAPDGIASARIRRGTVLLMEQAGHRSLCRCLDQLNYDVVSYDAMPRLEPGHDILAAIIDGSNDDGLNACAELPQDLPKVLVTSTISFAIRCAAARANIDAVIGLPLDVAELSDWLERFEQKKVARPISILLVEDHPLTAEMHAMILRNAGIEVTIVGDPIKIIAIIDAVRPDLILMDVKMPDVDGIELARIIRQCHQHLSLPIVFLSGERDETRQFTARRFGGDDFITKPADPARLVSIVRLRAERARSLRSMAERDSLTGLLNHGSFKDQAGQRLLGTELAGTPSSFAMIDIDHFKTINDGFGHPAGDKVIKTLARVLTARLRSSDVVGRYGGEEFAVLMPGSYPQEARRVFDGIRESFQAIEFESGTGRFSASFSAGVVAATGAIEAVTIAADRALYAAKAGGRNRVTVSTQ